MNTRSIPLILALVMLAGGCVQNATPSSPVTVSTTLEYTPISNMATDVGERGVTEGTPPAPAASEPPTVTLSPNAPTLIVQSQNMAGGPWSPDGHWVAFWVQAEGENPGKMTPGFYDVESEEVCYHKDLAGMYSTSSSTSYTYWIPDNRAVIVTDARQFTGEPCGSFEAVGSEVLPRWWSDSPDGRYRELTVYNQDAGVGTTTLIEAATGDVLKAIDWQNPMMSEGIVQWVGSNRLLVMNTDDRGPLLVAASGDTIEIIPEFFGLDVAVLPEHVVVSGALDEATGNAHFLLIRPDLKGPLLLYHSETGMVEEIPFRGTSGISTRQGYRRGFSPDGRWLLLQMPIDQQGDDYITDWVRPVDGSNDQAFIVAHSGGAFWGSGVTTLVAYNEQLPSGTSDYVIVTRFPDRVQLQSWMISGYSLGPLEWSPNGEILLMMGWKAETGEWALFLANVEPQ